MPHPNPMVMPRQAIPPALLIALAVRRLPSLLLPQTSFQPDEFFQSLEPAHTLVFGYGHLTWEWKDLPLYPGLSEAGGWYERVVVGGRMRGWIWPGVFALVYKVVQDLELEDRLLVLGPRLIGVAIAALTDYATYLLAIKFLGTGAGPAAMLLSLTSLFNAHILPRVLSTSPETLLTALALLYFPLPSSETLEPTSLALDPVAGDEATSKAPTADDKIQLADASGRHRLYNRSEMDYVRMDRMGPALETSRLPASSLGLSAVLATVAVCIRPTTVPLWAYLGVEHTVRILHSGERLRAFQDILRALGSAGAVFAASTGIDYAVTGRLYLPILTFIHYNFYSGLSANYGPTTPLYHLTQSLPIMLFPVWYWFAQGFLANLLPSRILPDSLKPLDRPPCLRTLSRAISFSIAALSLSPHSEWRFLHPFLPPLLLFCLPSLSKAYIPVQGVQHRLSDCFRQYVRMRKSAFYLVLLAPIIPFLYLNVFHGRAQVEVMTALRKGGVGEVKSLVALMPCHSTPWMSHLHMEIPAWFLTCEPPIGMEDTVPHHTQQSIFYDSPISYLRTVFPYPPSPLHKVFSSDRMDATKLPSHLILFGSLLNVGDDTETVAEVLESRGYAEAWSMWNGFDFAQDEEGRKGGVRVWTLQQPLRL